MIRNCPGCGALFARWTPGEAKAKFLEIGLNQLYTLGIYRFLFIKPRV